MTPEDVMCRVDALLSHVWMVRTFLKHSEEAEEDEELLRFLAESLIVPERQVTVLEAAPYRGVLTVKTEQGEVSLGYTVARQILVVPTPDS